jgi:hypothetical protein
MKKKVSKPCRLVANLMFFFDAFLALMIITGAGILIGTSFGTFSLFFGFVMLFVTTVLKVVNYW